MIAAWMVYGTVLGALAVCAALPLERYALRRGGATRFVWVGAFGTSLALPMLAVAFERSGLSTARPDGVTSAVLSVGAVARSVDALGTLDAVLMTGWLTVSAALAMLLVAGLGLTAWRSRNWTPTDVDGIPVLMSEDVGPAVVGFSSTFIVIPRWVCALADGERHMVLRHESEHQRTGDPRLALLGAVLVVALPWNVAVWLMAHRLRLAIEVDCDRRVLGAADVDVRRYAELLLTVGARRSSPLHAVGFSVGRPALEARIDRITLPPAERRWAQSFAVVLGVVGVLAAGWSLPRPVAAADSTSPVCPVDTSELSQRLLDASDWTT